jgi:hypothetical protein
MAEETTRSPRIHHQEQTKREKALRDKKVVQPGIGFPSASVQTQLLIVRLNLAPTRAGTDAVVKGLKRLCGLFAAIDSRFRPRGGRGSSRRCPTTKAWGTRRRTASGRPT